MAEFAANARHKLHRTGNFYDLGKDPGEAHPLEVDSLDDEAAAAKVLRVALDSYKDARPAGLTGSKSRPADRPRR